MQEFVNRTFAMHAIGPVAADRRRTGRGRYSLWTGDLGVALFLRGCLLGDAAVPTIDDLRTQELTWTSRGELVTRFVIDPPALLDLVRDGRAVAPAHQLVAPNAVRTQALELLLPAVSAGQLSEPEAFALHERITALKMRLLGDRVSRRAAWNLAREHGWDNLREAEYLAVTQLQADALVAGSPELARLATGIVALAPLRTLFA